MATTPWYTSDKLIEAVKRKILVPINQATFTEEDILAFANEEMFISQVPAVMQYHEEYFVYRVQTPLVSDISRYQIPDRAIGMKLRDLFWSDASGNYFEMTRIQEDDKAYFQRNIGANQAIHKFYLENNDVILTPSVVGDPTGSLNFFIFLRPNQLVRDSRARIFQSFTKDIQLTSNPLVGDSFVIQKNTSSVNPPTYKLIAVDADTYPISSTTPDGSHTIVEFNTAHNIPINTQLSVEITNVDPSINGIYYASVISSTEISVPKITSSVFSSGDIEILNSFVIGGSINETITNLVSSINLLSIPSTVASSLNSTSFTITTNDVTIQLTSIPTTDDSFSIETLIGFVLNQAPGDLIVEGSVVDFLQTKPGHRTYSYDITVQSVLERSGLHIMKVESGDLMTYYSNGYNFQPKIASIQVGDYVCLANECIIPQIPPDLHNVLAERTAARILAALGDTEGLQVSNAKLQEIEVRQGTLLDNRVEGAPQKVLARHSLLHYGRIGPRRRF